LSAATTPGWTWDPSLYAGSAPFYAVGRVGYPAEVADVLLAALALDGFGRLLDVGCGPGSLTLLLAPYFTEGIGVDADVNMLFEAARLAGKKDVRNVRWRHLRGEELPADLPQARLVTFAPSTGWIGAASPRAAYSFPAGAWYTCMPPRTKASAPTLSCHIRSRPARPSLGSYSAISARRARRDRAY